MSMLNRLRRNVEHVCKLIGSKRSLDMDDLSTFHKMDRKPRLSWSQSQALVFNMRNSNARGIMLDRERATPRPT